MEISNLSDAEFKTLVIRMLRELTVHSKSIKEGLKTTLSEIKEIYREPKVEEMKLGFKSTIWNIEKKLAFNQYSKKKKEFKRKEDSIRCLWDISKHTNI